MRDLDWIPGLGRFLGEGKSYPHQYSGLENSMDSPWSWKELDMTEWHSDPDNLPGNLRGENENPNEYLGLNNSLLVNKLDFLKLFQQISEDAVCFDHPTFFARFPEKYLCNPMDCSPPSSSVLGIFQARILKWVAVSSSRWSSQLMDWTCVSCVSCIGRGILYPCTTWKPWEISG